VVELAGISFDATHHLVSKQFIDMEIAFSASDSKMRSSEYDYINCPMTKLHILSLIISAERILEGIYKYLENGVM
jgi:folate-dependent tRNA-U54 methylase TrmFO/GidA